MSDYQYLIPGEDFQDETAGEGQHLVPGQGFVDVESTATAAQRPVVFVAT